MCPRKKSENPKNARFEIRLDKSTADTLNECAEKLNITKTAVIRKGIDMVKADIKK